MLITDTLLYVSGSFNDNIEGNNYLKMLINNIFLLNLMGKSFCPLKITLKYHLFLSKIFQLGVECLKGTKS